MNSLTVYGKQLFHSVRPTDPKTFTDSGPVLRPFGTIRVLPIVSLLILVCANCTGYHTTFLEPSITGLSLVEPGKPGSQGGDLIKAKWVSSQVTSENRVYDTAGGGWGPHLRGLMRNSKGELFFAVDKGPSVSVNSAIDYYKKQDNVWVKIGAQNQINGIQQNVASLMGFGRYILSYGISVSPDRPRFLQQCYFDTFNFAYKACNAMFASGSPIEVEYGSNYVGAAADRNSEARIVWWNTANGKWAYTFTSDGYNWSRPLTFHLNGYGGFLYVNGVIVRADPGTSPIFVGVGQLISGSYPDNYSIQGGVLRFKIGAADAVDPAKGDESQKRLANLWPKDGEFATGKRIFGSSSDIFVDPLTNAVHIMASKGDYPNIADGALAYFFHPNYEIPNGGLTARDYFRDQWYSRFHFDGCVLSLVISQAFQPQLHLYRIPANTAGSPILFAGPAKIDTSVVSIPSHLNRADAIYVEDHRYQAGRLASGFEIGVVGAFSYTPRTDNEIWNLTLQETQLGVNSKWPRSILPRSLQEK